MKWKIIFWALLIWITLFFLNTVFLNKTFQNSHSKDNTNNEIILSPFQPNIEWKSRKVILKDGTTLEYELGKGNPEGSRPLSDEEILEYSLCYSEKDPTCRTDIGYVTSRLEVQLIHLLSDPRWQTILESCKEDFIKSEKENYFWLTYNEIIKERLLDIENWIQINPKTWRKEIHTHLHKISHCYSHAFRNSINNSQNYSCIQHYDWAYIANNILNLEYDNVRPFWHIIKNSDWKNIFKFPPNNPNYR